MYANVLKFHVLIPHEKIGDPYFFLSQSSPILELFPFDKITLKSYICTVVTVMAKQCWSQTVLESGSWGHSVLQTPALVSSVTSLSFSFLPYPSHLLYCLFYLISLSLEDNTK